MGNFTSPWVDYKRFYFDWSLYCIGAYDLLTVDGREVEGIEHTDTGYNVMINGEQKISKIKGNIKPKIFKYRKDGTHEFGDGWRLIMKLKNL